MKTTLAVIGIALLAALAVFGLMDLPSATASATSGVDAKTIEVTPSKEMESALRPAVDPADEGASGVEGRLGYRNDVYGFVLLLPETWQGYRTTTETLVGVSAVYFWFDRESPATAFQIAVYAHQEWDRLRGIEGRALCQPVAQTSEFVFCYSLGVTANEDPFMSARLDEVPVIMETLQVTG